MAKTASYRELSEKLDAAMAWFDSDELDIDQLPAKYKETLELIRQMEERLKTAQNQIKKLAKD